jgi:tetratricopeptide (TPR) repeat protein
MKKFILILLLFSITGFVSFKYSERVYVNYLRIYYNKFYTEKDLDAKARKLYDEKKYKEAENFLEPLLNIYPENIGFKKIAAFNYFQLGDTLKSAEIFAGIPVDLMNESRILEEMIKNLYYDGHYGDLIFFYEKGIMLNNVNTSLYYGVSLYKKGRYDESLTMLNYVKKNTYMLPELSFYLGLNLEKKGKEQESIGYIKYAFESDRHNQIYKKALIASYRKSGLYKEAEILLRSR